MVYSGLVNFTFWTNCTLFSKYLSFMPKSGSKLEISLPFACSLPTSCTPSSFVTLNVADTGPSLPSPVEYTCHPLSILPVNTISPSAVLPVFSVTVNFTGSSICALAATAITSSKARVIIFFILLVIVVLYYLRGLKGGGLMIDD